jgi:hypothetical protein
MLTLIKGEMKMTFEEAQKVFSEFTDQFKMFYKRVASSSLQKDYEGTGQGIGSSDIYYRAIELVRETDGQLNQLVDINWELSQEGY